MYLRTMCLEMFGKIRHGQCWFPSDYAATLFTPFEKTESSRAQALMEALIDAAFDIREEEVRVQLFGKVIEVLWICSMSTVQSRWPGLSRPVQSQHCRRGTPYPKLQHILFTSTYCA